MLERKDFEELKTFKQRLQMQNIKESHTQTRDGLIDEEAVWKDHEEQQRRLALLNNHLEAEKQGSPAS